MEFKKNLNKIHYQLTDLFDDVVIKECSSILLGEYIELSITEKLTCKVIINKKSLNNNRFDWSYSVDPTDDKSDSVSRTSDIESFTNDINDVLVNKRFDTNYLKKFN